MVGALPWEEPEAALGGGRESAQALGRRRRRAVSGISQGPPRALSERAPTVAAMSEPPPPTPRAGRPSSVHPLPEGAGPGQAPRPRGPHRPHAPARDRRVARDLRARVRRDRVDGSMGATSSATGQTTASAPRPGRAGRRPTRPVPTSRASSSTLCSSDDSRTPARRTIRPRRRTTRARSGTLGQHARARTRLLEQPRPPSPPASPRGRPMLAAAVTEHLFWITSRAAGTAALLLSSLAVCVGLLFGGKLVKGRARPAPPPRGAVARDDRRARRARRRAARRRLPAPELRRHHDPVRQRLHAAVDDASGSSSGWAMIAPRPLLLRRATASASSAGRSCIASPRSPGSPASRTRSARARTPARRGSSSRPRSSSSPRSCC